MPSLPESVAQLWRDTGSSPRPSAGAESLIAFELNNGVAIPEELAAFYQVTNGIESDSNLFAVWELADVRRVPAALGDFRGIPDYGRIAETLPNANEYFAFADFMIMFHVFAVYIAPDSSALGEIIWISGSEHGIAAKSFRDFWGAYLNDPMEAVQINS
jgi:hypothetical protein